MSEPTFILSVDTFGPMAQVVLSERDEVRAAASLNLGRTHSRSLSPLIEAVMAQAGVTWSDLVACGAVVGPGSFTGLRIGTSTIQGIALVAETPVIGISSLAALANRETRLRDASATLVVPVIDARNRRAYHAVFEQGQGLPRRVTEDGVDSYEAMFVALDAAVAKLTPTQIVLCGPGTEPMAEDEAWQAWIRAQRQANLHVTLVLEAAPRPESIARLAWDALDRGATLDPEQLLPAYLAPTQAERNLRNAKPGS